MHILIYVYLRTCIIFSHTCCRRRRMVLFCRWGMYSCSSGSFSAWSFTQFRTYQKSEKLLYLHWPVQTSPLKKHFWFTALIYVQILFYWSSSFDQNTYSYKGELTVFVWRRLTVLATFTILLIYLQVLFSTSNIFVPTIKEKEHDVLHQLQNLH